MLRHMLMVSIAAAALSVATLGEPARAVGPEGEGWQGGVWRGAGWEWRGGPGWAGRWAWRRGTVAPGWGSFYPGPGYYPFGYPYGYAYPYAPRGSYGCYRPVPVQGPGKWNFVRERVC
jgi:hypothetical protein